MEKDTVNLSQGQKFRCTCQNHESYLVGIYLNETVACHDGKVQEFDDLISTFLKVHCKSYNILASYWPNQNRTQCTNSTEDTENNIANCMLHYKSEPKCYQCFYGYVVSYDEKSCFSIFNSLTDLTTQQDGIGCRHFEDAENSLCDECKAGYSQMKFEWNNKCIDDQDTWIFQLAEKSMVAFGTYDNTGYNELTGDISFSVHSMVEDTDSSKICHGCEINYRRIMKKSLFSKI